VDPHCSSSHPFRQPGHLDSGIPGPENSIPVNFDQIRGDKAHAVYFEEIHKKEAGPAHSDNEINWFNAPIAGPATLTGNQQPMLFISQ
jgi:hypothetical protein